MCCVWESGRCTCHPVVMARSEVNLVEPVFSFHFDMSSGSCTQVCAHGKHLCTLSHLIGEDITFNKTKAAYFMQLEGL